MCFTNPRSGIGHASATIAAGFLLAGAGHALADATGRSFNNSATIQLTPSSGGVLTFTSDPNLRRSHATAYADHSDTTGSSFNESTTTNAAAASASEPNVATVSNAFANMAALSLGVDNALSFAHRSPPSNARADGLAELEAIFHVTYGTPPPTFSLLLSVNGSASLSGDSLADENWSANFQVYVEVYDFSSPSSPVLASGAHFDQLDGPGPLSRTDTIAITQNITGMIPGHDYGLYAYFDAESFAIAPAPGTAVLGGLLGLLAARRRRGRPEPII